MELGSRIRLLRRGQRRTQQEVADACGFTKSLMSKIESGQTVPPVATLMKIAKALGTNVADLLAAEPESATVYTPSSHKDNAEKWVDTNKGYSFFTYAAGMSGKLMQPYLFRARKGEVKDNRLSHDGEEFIYMLEGIMKYRVGTIEYTLEPGDSLFFQSVQEHNLVPITDEVVYLAVFAEIGSKDND